MKIVCLGPCGNTFKGGIAQFFSTLVTALEPEHQVAFITWLKMYPAFLLKRNFKDEVSKDKITESKAKPILSYCNPFSIYKFIRAVPKDTELVILNWAHPVHAPHYIVIIRLLKLFRKAKIVLLCHNVIPHERFSLAKTLSKLVFHLADKIIIHSSSEERKMLTFVSNSKVVKLFLPLHDFFVEELTPEIKTKRFCMLFFGIIRHYKGVDILLEALTIVKREIPQIKLIIAGENFYSGKDDNSIELLIDSLQLKDCVELCNYYIPNEEVSGFFSRSDVVVFPFRSVTQSGSLTLALAHNKPVIVSHLKSFTDLITEGKTGCIFKSESPESLANAIVRFYSLDNMTPGIIKLKAELTWERYVKQLIYALQ